MNILVVTAMYPTPERPSYGTFIHTQVRSLRAADVDVDVLVLKARNRKLMYPKGVIDLRARLRARPADLVHAHYSYVGLVAATQPRAPVVVTYHGSDLLGLPAPSGRRLTWSTAAAGMAALLGEAVEGVIVQTPAMAARLRRPDVHVIPHEVDLELFRPAPRGEARAALGLDPHRPYVLFAAPPQVPVKNFGLARDAVGLVRRCVADVELLVVYREPQPRLALYMSAADALVFPSRQEGSPNVVKQAMACNLPIVATDVGDVRSVIGGVAGCHVVAPSPEAFAASLCAVLSTGARTDGRSAVASLAPPVVAQRVAAVYEEVIGRSERRRGVLGRRALAVGRAAGGRFLSDA